MKTAEEVVADLIKLEKVPSLDLTSLAELCCNDKRCWALNDLDAYLPPGCANCWAEAGKIPDLLLIYSQRSK